MGLPVDLFTDPNINGEFICSICHDVLDDPSVITSCEHTFCNECIETWRDTSNTCPVDRQVIDRLIYPQRNFMNLLNELEMYCPFWTQGCTAVFKLGDKEDHCSRCEYDPNQTNHEQSISIIICVDGCGAELNLSEVEGHNCLAYLGHRNDNNNNAAQGQPEQRRRYMAPSPPRPPPPARQTPYNANFPPIPLSPPPGTPYYAPFLRSPSIPEALRPTIHNNMLALRAAARERAGAGAVQTVQSQQTFRQRIRPTSRSPPPTGFAAASRTPSPQPGPSRRQLQPPVPPARSPSPEQDDDDDDVDALTCTTRAAAIDNKLYAKIVAILKAEFELSPFGLDQRITSKLNTLHGAWTGKSETSVCKWVVGVRKRRQRTTERNVLVQFKVGGLKISISRQKL